MALHTVCSWCGVVMVQGTVLGPTSHGCCKACKDKLLGHKYEDHKDGCPAYDDGGSGHCNICDGGLALCTVCGGAEGTLATHCPGVRVTEELSARVYAGTIDYVDGKWVTPVCKQCKGTGRIPFAPVPGPGDTGQATVPCSRCQP